MSIAHRIQPQLPMLRRFARALTGSQQAGDASVVTLLKALSVDPALYSEALDPRIALYRAFLATWSRQGPSDADMSPSADAAVAVADRRLVALSAGPRQAFLLVAVEGFKPAEAAKVLGISEIELVELLDLAGRDLAQQVATSVLIIEDEPIISMDLENLVCQLGHRPQGVARTRAQAIAMARQQQPGLVIADIQLADGSSGLDAVNELLQSFSVPVVFVTAFPERLLTGARPEPTFLITKPFDVGMLKAIISQALFFDRRAHPAQRRVGTL